MSTEGIEAVFLETHNWGKTAKFFTELGYELEFDTGHNSGQLRNGDTPYVFIAEVPADQEPGMRLVFKVATKANLRLLTPAGRSPPGSPRPDTAMAVAGVPGPQPLRPGDAGAELRSAQAPGTPGSRE